MVYQYYTHTYDLYLYVLNNNIILIYCVKYIYSGYKYAYISINNYINLPGHEKLKNADPLIVDICPYFHK